MTRRELHLENVRLSDENKQLRAWMTNMLLVVARRDELVEIGLQEIERRWPDGCAGAPFQERVAA